MVKVNNKLVFKTIQNTHTDMNVHFFTFFKIFVKACLGWFENEVQRLFSCCLR